MLVFVTPPDVSSSFTLASRIEEMDLAFTLSRTLSAGAIWAPRLRIFPQQVRGIGALRRGPVDRHSLNFGGLDADEGG